MTLATTSNESPKMSRKRAHSELATDSHQEHRDQKARTELSIDAATQTKASAGPNIRACWRCKALKKQCDNERICGECSNSNDAAWDELGCQRWDLHGQLEDVFPNMPGLGSNEWLLPAADGITLKVRMTYDRPNIEIRDVDIFEFTSQEDPYRAFLPYLKQFHDVNSRWGNWYEPITVEMITICARIQEDIVMKLRPGRKRLCEDNLIIALALRTFALSHNISAVEGNMSPLPHECFMEMLYPVPMVTTDPGHNLTIEIRRYFAAHDTAIPKLKNTNGGKLTSLVVDIFRVAQRLLLRGRPADWPSLICVICLLKLIMSSSKSFIPCIEESFRGEEDFQETWVTLCQLFDSVSQGNHPLVEAWRSSKYESLVGSGNISMGHFELLNELWVDGGFDDADNDEPLSMKAQHLAMGFIDDDW